MRIEVISDETDTSRQMWCFYVRAGLGETRITLVLDLWRQESRATKRHKWRSDKWEKTEWGRTGQRENRIPRPTVPDEVKREALRLLMEDVRFEADPIEHDRSGEPQP